MDVLHMRSIPQQVAGEGNQGVNATTLLWF